MIFKYYYLKNFLPLLKKKLPPRKHPQKQSFLLRNATSACSSKPISWPRKMVLPVIPPPTGRMPKKSWTASSRNRGLLIPSSPPPVSAGAGIFFLFRPHDRTQNAERDVPYNFNPEPFLILPILFILVSQAQIEGNSIRTP